MKPRTRIWQIVIVLTAIAIPLELAAQQTGYKLIDLGTFGGPQSYFNVPPQGWVRLLTNSGRAAGWADTSAPDPYPDFCFNADCFVSHAFQWQNGVPTDLGTLTDGLSSLTTFISENGLIAGFAENGEIDPLITGFPENRAVLWKNGKITNLGTLPEGGYESFTTAVNSRAQVAGWALNTVPDANSMACPGFCTTETRAFLWQNGVMQDLGTLGGPDAMALVVNERGQVVGDSYTSSDPSNYCAANIGFPLATGAFLWDGGEMKNLGNLGGTCTFVFDLNSRGQVIGASTLTGDLAQHPFVWENGSLNDLGTFGGNLGLAIAISDSGKIAGWASYPGDQTLHAALWSNGVMTDLGTLEGDTLSFAFDVNAQGEVVGSSVDANFNLRGFLWNQGTIVDLNSLVGPDSPLDLTVPVNINDQGEIAILGVDADGNQHAAILIPCGSNDTCCETRGGNPVRSASRLARTARGMAPAQGIMRNLGLIQWHGRLP